MQLLHGAFPAQRPHGLSIAPLEMLSELVIQLINVSKPLPIIEISLVVAVAPLHPVSYTHLTLPTILEV